MARYTKRRRGKKRRKLTAAQKRARRRAYYKNRVKPRRKRVRRLVAKWRKRRAASEKGFMLPWGVPGDEARKPIWIDDWRFVGRHLVGTLRSSGKRITTSRVINLNMGLGWVKTASGSLYYLGHKR